ncbi:MAG: shikimate kinase [Paraprevotella sp.]|nr:shikimate kinase [Paraprevotella sp.]
MIRIALTGYMGAGKTTIGRILAKELDIPFYDLDWYIEERFHKTIAQIFADKGEEGFRNTERQMLHEVAEFENIVLSCGGGTPCFFDNMDYLNRQATTVYLKATPEVLFQHLKMGKTERPLLKNKTEEEMIRFIKESLAGREPFYNRAKHIFDINLLDNHSKIKDTVYQLRKTINI